MVAMSHIAFLPPRVALSEESPFIVSMCKIVSFVAPILILDSCLEVKHD